MGSMDRLVQLFLQSMDPEGHMSGKAQKGPPTEEGIDNAINVTLQMLSGEQAIAYGAHRAGTFCLLAMALEEKPGLQDAAIRCYEKTMQLITDRGGSWERCTVLEQLGKTLLNSKRYAESEKYMLDCLIEIDRTKGHPRDVQLFAGGFTTNRTRREFTSTAHKILAKLYMEQGRQQDLQYHYRLAQELEKEVSGDIVEKMSGGSESTKGGPHTKTSGQTVAQPVDEIAQLWQAVPLEKRNLKLYSYTDEDQTVSMILDLNEHLGIGPEASAAVTSLRQFKIECENDKCDVKLRLKHQGCIWEFRLLLLPLYEEIIPEDTVPKLKGKPEKRRLEVKLFKKDKKRSWYKLLNETEEGKRRLAQEVNKGVKEAETQKATQFNPLSAEELAALPVPGGNATNRPRNVQSAPVSSAPAAKAPTPPAQTGGYAQQTQPQPQKSQQSETKSSGDLPAWAAGIEKRSSADGSSVDVMIRIADAFDKLGLDDLELDINPTTGVRLHLRDQGSKDGGVIEVPVPSGTDGTAANAKWRKKTRTLEIRFPVR